MTKPKRFREWACLLCALLLCPLSAVARPVDAADDELEEAGIDRRAPREDRVPTAARRAREWEPSPDASGGPEGFGSASVGTVFFSGDDEIENGPGFGAELKVGRELASDFYVVGSYLFAVAETETIDPLDGTFDEDPHTLHVPTIGVGFRAAFTPEIHAFVEPRVGALLGGDVDGGPVGGGSAGVEIQLDPGIAVRVSFTGLFTDSSLETAAGDVDLNGIWSVGVGLAFEF